MTLLVNLVKRYGIMGLLGITFSYMVISGCASQSGSTSDELSAAEKARLDSLARVADRQCKIYLSTAFEYFKNKEYEGSLRNYTKMVNSGCTEKYGDRVWVFLGNSYREMDKPDSAMWAFNKGLSEEPDNISLHENVAFMFQLSGDNDKVIAEYETIAALDSSNIARWRKLHDLYFRVAEYEKDLGVLKKIIKMDPEDIIAKNDLVTVMKFLGEDPTELLEERHLNNPDNPEFLLEYANTIYQTADYEKAIPLYEKLLSLEPDHFLALDRIATSYKNLDNTGKALSSLKRLLKLRPNDKTVVYDITDLYKQAGELKTAYSWANKTINTKPKDGRGFYIRGLVLEAAANNCQNERGAKVPSIYDKLVFEVALDDVKESVALGYTAARSRIQFLEQQVPSKGDIFMHPEKFQPEGDCYKWIKRKVKRK